MYLYRRINDSRKQSAEHGQALDELNYEAGLRYIGFDQLTSFPVYRSLRKLKHAELVVLELVETSRERTWCR